jgi:hypothetical protein
MVPGQLQMGPWKENHNELDKEIKRETQILLEVTEENNSLASTTATS